MDFAANRIDLQKLPELLRQIRFQCRMLFLQCNGLRNRCSSSEHAFFVRPLGIAPEDRAPAQIISALVGLFSPVLAKHTKHLSLVDILSVGVDRMQRNFDPMKKQVEVWKGTRLPDDTAKLVIYRAFVEGKLDAPQTLGPARSRRVFQPSGRGIRSANSLELVQRVHKRFQGPRPDPSVQDYREARVVP